jgi:exodeoxyribonuclease VII large subunit
MGERLFQMAERLKSATQQIVSHAEKDLHRHIEKLNALSPLNVLARGYAIAFKLPENQVLKSAAGLKSQDEVRVLLHEGEFTARVV